MISSVAIQLETKGDRQ